MKIEKLLEELKKLSDIFRENGVKDIYTNSKIYEVLIANQLGHQIINGHARSSDAKDEEGNRYEYKHYKKSSSNHTWTFNDFTPETIERLCEIKFVCFVIIDDKDAIPRIEKVYIVPGKKVAKYLEKESKKIKNKRKMINISVRQITKNMPYKVMKDEELKEKELKDKAICPAELKEIFVTARKIEEKINVDGLLTSNKLWELLVACELGHEINSEQKRHDAHDAAGRTYEYKVSKRKTWTFQDISKNVLESYLNDEKIILAEVDKRAFAVRKIVECQPKAIIKILKKKLADKEKKSSEVRRLTANIGINDVKEMVKKGDAKWIL